MSDNEFYFNLNITDVKNSDVTWKRFLMTLVVSYLGSFS